MIKRFTCMVIILVGFCFCDNESDQEHIVAMVNGNTISVPELELIMQKNRAGVYNYFCQKYDAGYSDTFWTQQYNNEIPIVQLKKIALDECVRIKIQQALALERNLIDTICFSELMENLHHENIRRQKAVEEKKVIYGPTNLTELSYFNYVYSNMVIQLKRHLAAEKFDLSEGVLKQYYDEHFSAHIAEKEQGDVSFQSIRENVKSRYIDDQYNSFIHQLVKEAKIKINQSVYQTL